MVPKVYIVTPMDVVVFTFREIWPTGKLNNARFHRFPEETGENEHYLPDLKILGCLSNCCYSQTIQKIPAAKRL